MNEQFSNQLMTVPLYAEIWMHVTKQNICVENAYAKKWKENFHSPLLLNSLIVGFQYLIIRINTAQKLVILINDQWFENRFNVFFTVDFSITRTVY